MIFGICMFAVVIKKEGQTLPCGISTVISCSLLNKASTVETSFLARKSVGLAERDLH